MKALTIKEPWVTCILKHGKRIENRTWRLPHGMQGQRIALHTAKTIDKAGLRVASELAFSTLRENKLLPLGFVVATARIVKCVAKSPDPWFFGPYGFVLDEVKPLDEPLMCRGALGFWELPKDIVDYWNSPAEDTGMEI